MIFIPFHFEILTYIKRCLLGRYIAYFFPTLSPSGVPTSFNNLPLKHLAMLDRFLLEVIHWTKIIITSIKWMGASLWPILEDKNVDQIKWFGTNQLT